jgi:hypothetical protein
MKFSERNNILQEINQKFAMNHDIYTNSARILTDDEWQDYVHRMDAVSNEYKDTNMKQFAADLCMAYLDDTEYVQKKLREVKKE